MKNRFFTALFALVFGAAFATTSATAATINVPADMTLPAAVAAASPGDLILVAAGTYVIGSTITVSTANLTIQGAGIGSSVLQVSSAVGDMFDVLADGTTLRDFSIEKTDVAGLHNLIWINADNVTVRDNEIYGPDPGSPWSVNGIVSRGLVVSPGRTGLLIQGNNIHHLRQPAYIDGPAGVNRGSILNNHVSGTRGWVLAGALLTMSGNTWGPPENQGAEIALLSTCTVADYPNLLALSAANGNAYISDQFSGGPSGRATAYVDDSAAPGGFGDASAPYQTVTDGVNNTLAGGVVDIAAGSYTEQVVVSGKDLTLDGAGRAATFIKSPAALTAFFTTSANNYPVVLLQNASDIRVRDLTVDGDGQGNANYRFMGIAYWNAGGKVLDCDVVRVRNTPWDGMQHGNAVYAYHSAAGPYAIEVGGCNVSDFQKNGITMNGAAVTANVHDCVVTGNGPTPITAQNGIQIGFGAGATLANNAVSDIGYTGADWTAAGVLLYQNAAVTATGGSVTNCQIGYASQDGDASITNASISTNFVAGTGAVLPSINYPAYGITHYNSSTSSPNARSAPVADGAGRHPGLSPAEEDAGAFSRTGPMATNAAYTVSVTGGCLTGTDQPGSEGIDIYSSGGPVSALVTGVEISDWDLGIVNFGPGASVNAHHNALFSNVTAGFSGDPAAASNGATPNWWGAASGPSGAGPGTGDAVSGATVAFAPWLISGADANPGCGFAAASDNVISAGPAPSCISTGNPCITIPVAIAHTTSENIRGFSVTLQLSSNLLLCSGPSSITQGTYLSLIGGTTFQVVSNGGGSYTVDCAILGLPCGQTAATGTLFNLQVMKAPGPDGTGTITLGPVLARDCDNAAIVANAGAPLSITIDTGGPAAVANLAAAQQKTLNDADGTTKVQLTFTAPGDAATVEVYRAPWGTTLLNTYPEYDDVAGGPPAAPAYPPAAPGALTGVTASGQSDETTARGFWYYVMFSKDACGNVSAASNLTGGTLNYHLGDVTNGTPGNGDNLVGTIDITLLGAHYGITLAPADPFNYLDVGPTTDFSVNARPTTDNKVGFEDLMMFAINYGTVSMPQDGPALASAAANALGVGDVPASAIGETFTVPVRMSGAGNVLGASLAFGFDPKVAEFVSAEAGGLLNSQGREGVVLSPSAGVVDFALLGEGAGVLGEGTLLNVTFRRVGAGDPAIALRGVTARDGANRPVALAGTKPAAPLVTQMSSPFPNPFRGNTNLRLALARDGRARVAIYDLVGRRVRTLVDGLQPAGERMIVWDGRDDGGQSVPAGLYLVRFTGDGVEQSRRVILTQ